jgi:hypothetical protein
MTYWIASLSLWLILLSSRPGRGKRSQPSLLSSPCLRRLPQKCGALRLKPWSAVQKQTHRWRKVDSNHRYPEDKVPLRDGLLSPP